MINFGLNRYNPYTNDQPIDLGPGFENVDQSSESFKKALHGILETDDDLFIMGPGGTGKSVLVRIAQKNLSGRTLVVAPTGAAATSLTDAGVDNVCTLHSGLKIPVDPFYSDYTTIRTRELKYLKNLNTLIIDEISMVSCDLLDQVSRVLDKVTKNRVRLIVFGDPFQLPPVIPSKEVLDHFKEEYKGTFFFHSHTWNDWDRHFKIIRLDTVYRQEQADFKQTLDRVRIGIPSAEDFNLLNSRVQSFDTFSKTHPTAMILATSNREVEYLNETYGIPKDEAGNPTESCKYMAVVTGPFFSEKDYQGYLKKEVVIHVGQQVMCIRNDPEEGYHNGTTAIVKKLFLNGVQATCADGRDIFIEAKTWEKKKLSTDADGNLSFVVEATFRQIACVPAKAITFHKAQGLTLDSVYLSLGGWVPHAVTYLGLSRCKTLEGIGLSRVLRPRDISLNEEAFDFQKKIVMETPETWECLNLTPHNPDKVVPFKRSNVHVVNIIASEHPHPTNYRSNQKSQERRSIDDLLKDFARSSWTGDIIDDTISNAKKKEEKKEEALLKPKVKKKKKKKNDPIG